MTASSSSKETLKQQMRQALEMFLGAVESGKTSERDLERLMQQWPSPPGMSKKALLQQVRAMTPAQRDALIDQVAALMSGEKPKGIRGFLLQRMLRNSASPGS